MSRLILPSGLQIPDSAEECLYPGLYPNAGWWCPSLQPQGGFKLFNYSLPGTWGNLSNMLAQISTCWVTSQGRGALTFDGVDDFVNFGNVSAFNNLPLSFSCWYRPSGTTGARTIFEKYSSGPAGVFCFQNGNAISFQMGGSGSSNRVTGGTLVAGEWYHVAATVSPTLITLYINATSVGTPLAPGSANSSTQPFTFCGTNSGIGYGSGMIDDFRAYSRALTAYEVRQLWQLNRGNLPVKTKRKYVFVSAAGDQTITANLLTNTSTVYNPTVSAGAVNITANLFTNTSTVYQPTIAAGVSNISADLLANTSTVYNPTVAAGAANINANLFTNTNTFYDAVVSVGDTIVANLLTNTSTVYNPTVTAGAVNITAQLLSNTSTVYLPTVALLVDNISAFRIDNTSVIYLPTLTGGDAGVKDTSDILSRGLKRKKKRKTQEEIDEENIAAQILKARQGKQPKYEKPKQELQLNLKTKLEAEQPIATIVEDVINAIETPAPFTDEMKQEIAKILNAYQVKLKQQRRAKQLKALMLLATMDD